MPTPLTLSELKSHLWNCAEILRGSAVDRTDWKAYILPLLFFKRICDVWDEETAEAAGLFGDVDPTEFPEVRRVVVPEGSHWQRPRGPGQRRGCSLTGHAGDRAHPACGTGGMLLGAVEHVQRAGGDARTFFGKIYGQEKNLTASRSHARAPRGQRRFQGFDDKILALYARGLSTREIQRYLAELNAVNVGRDLISRVSGAVVAEVREWRQRPRGDVHRCSSSTRSC